jgi:hypothetical protein
MADYHFTQASDYFKNPQLDTIHQGISDFCAMIETIESSLNIARDCAAMQSTLETKIYIESLKDHERNELHYIEQFIKANKKKQVFNFIQLNDIEISAIPNKHELKPFPERKLLPYIQEVKKFTDLMIEDLLRIYKGSTVRFDQSWRNIDLFRGSFVCIKCGSIVTKILKHIDSLSKISLREKDSLLPNFTYVYGSEVIKAGLLPWKGENEVLEDEILIPASSLKMDVRVEAATGCCGSDSSVTNVFCRNGHPIGKKASDCWMPHFIRLTMIHVKKVEIL